MKSKKHNCYTCRFRGKVDGSAHSSCSVLESIHGPAKGFALGFVAAVRGDGYKKINLHPHGVANGLAMWPINFDPVWVEECGYYEEQKPEE